MSAAEAVTEPIVSGHRASRRVGAAGMGLA
jgi:hypothetical protein